MQRETILVVDDDPGILAFIKTNLQARGYRILTATSGPEALSAAALDDPDLVILDLLMPDVDGMEVTRALRERSTVPIIVLSALQQDVTKVRALELGADDYMTKPFSVEELLARVRAVLRRARGRPQPPRAVVRAGDLEIDFPRSLVRVRGQPIHLTPTERRLLEEFASHPGKILSHATLLTRVWGQEYQNEAQYLRVYIRRLRRKIERDPDRPEVIVTEPRVGYRFVLPGEDERPRAGGEESAPLTTDTTTA